MSIKEIRDIESGNVDCIHLYREGLFWRAYEVSAFLFVTYIKEYRAIKKYYKVVQDDVVYVGFPHTQIDSVMIPLAKYEITLKEEKSIKTTVGSSDLSKYKVWKAEVKEFQSKVPEDNIIAGDTKYQILEEIAAYPLATKTPLDVQQYMYEVQKRIVEWKEMTQHSLLS